MTRQIKGPSTDTLEREYVYSDPPVSITDLSVKYDLARSNVADKARAGKWYEKREAFRAKVADKVTDAMAEKWAEMQIATYERLAKVGTKHFDMYEAALEAGEIKTNTRDFISVASMVVSILDKLAQKPVGVKDPRDVSPDDDLDAGEARQTIDYVRRLMAGGDDAGTDPTDE